MSKNTILMWDEIQRSSMDLRNKLGQVLEEYTWERFLESLHWVR